MKITPKKHAASPKRRTPSKPASRRPRSARQLPSVRTEDPFDGLPEVFRPWTGFFDDFILPEPLSGIALPDTEVTEEPDAFLVKLDVPGVTKDNIEVSAEGGMLTVSAHRHTKTKTSESTLEYRRALSLPDHVKPDGIEASLEHGILTLRVPKDKSAKTHRISVK